MDGNKYHVRVDPHVWVDHEEILDLQEVEERIVMEDVGQTFVSLREDHELPLWEEELYLNKVVD